MSTACEDAAYPVLIVTDGSRDERGVPAVDDQQSAINAGSWDEGGRWDALHQAEGEPGPPLSGELGGSADTSAFASDLHCVISTARSQPGSESKRRRTGVVM